MKKEKHFNLRIDPELLAKFRCVCEYEARSMNNQLLIFVRNAVRRYEKEHGEIEVKHDETC